MASEFSSNRSLSAEARLRAIEDHLADSFRLDTAAEEQAATLGGGVEAVVIAGGGGGGGSGVTSLQGDVTGPTTANTVDRIEGADIPTPVAGDDRKFVKLNATPAFTYSHIDRIQDFAIPAPVAGDDEKFIRYQHGTPAFEYAFVVMAGDVTGTNPTTSVVRIQGKDIAAPGAAQDKQAVVFDNAADDFVYRALTALTLLGAWTRADISTLGAADVVIDNAFAGDTALANVMPRAGSLVSIAVKLSGDVDGGAGAGNDLVVTVRKNGVATTLTVTVTGGAGTEDEAFATVTPVTFVAGDDIDVVAKEVGAAAAVRAAVQVWGRFDAF